MFLANEFVVNPVRIYICHKPDVQEYVESDIMQVII
jgi:hypothetical protein